MNLEAWIWLCTGAYAVHMMEEFMLNWRDWARAVIKLPVEWPDFYLTNSIVVVIGIVGANLAGAAPWLALAFPGVMLINAVFFHVLPVIWTRGRYSPGVFTAVVLFLPIAFATYRAAADAGVLTTGTFVGSLLLAAVLMATPIVLLHLANRPYFRQDRP